jgi:hypothetical protein
VTDDAVRAAASRGVRVLFTLSGPPSWAQGAGRPAGAGAWRPDPAAFAAFASAAAKRYSGSFPDPERPGSVLPPVRYWQVWNEPNLTTALGPQWVRRGGRYVAESPRIYRALLNSGYRALKAVSRRNYVVAAGTAPYGDLVPGGRRIAPVDFMRRLFSAKVRLDAISHHPYAVGGPLRHALNRNDVAIPDLGKLRSVLRAAERAGTALPRGRKALWVTEISWDSSPPDPDGVPEATHARWLEEALYLLWKQGVSTVTWFRVRDQDPQPSFAATNQSGVFFGDGRPKLAATAFRFPFVVRRTKARATYWGRAPGAGPIAIQTLTSGGWRLVVHARRRAAGLFHGSLGHRRGSFRAVANGYSSLPWRVGP